MAIRPFTTADYDDLIRVGNLVYPENPGTVEEERFYDERRDPKCKWGRFLALEYDRVVGVGGFEQPPGMFHPRKFHIHVMVEPPSRGRGTGTALYERLVRELERHDPILLRSGAREDRSEGVRFLEKRGFREELRAWELRLDLAKFDPSRFGEAEERARAAGITIRSLEELGSEPDLERRLYEMRKELFADVPRPDEYTPSSFEQFQKMLKGNPNFLPDGYFVAVRGDEWIGCHDLWRFQADADIHVGLCAVKRGLRRQGIAMAMKLRAIRYAVENGYPGMRTGNDSTNVGMLAINERLGFVRKPAWIGFVKELASQ